MNKSHLNFASALLHQNLYFCLKRYAKPLPIDQLERAFSVNVIRATSGAGTSDDPIVYYAPTSIHGAFPATETSRCKFALTLAFNGVERDRDTGTNPSLLALAGYPRLGYVQQAIAFQSVLQFLEQRGLIEIDIREVQSRLEGQSQGRVYGTRSVEAFNAINDRSLDVLNRHGIFA